MYQSVLLGRKGIGFELKESYFNEAVKNIKSAEIEKNQKNIVRCCIDGRRKKKPLPLFDKAGVKVKKRKTDYKKKLDEVFSQYIRLKYSDKRGYCRCISCGRIHFLEGYTKRSLYE